MINFIMDINMIIYTSTYVMCEITISYKLDFSWNKELM